MTFGVLAAFAAIVFAALGGVGMSWLVQLRSADLNWVARPLAGILALALTGLAAAFFGAALFNRRDDSRGLLYGIAIVWHMIGIALAVTLPGAAYLMIVPGLAVTICVLAHMNETTISAVAATVAAILIFPIAITIYDALGGNLMAAIAVIVGMFATLVVPLFARARNGIAAMVLAAGCAAIALAQPAFTPDKPRFISLSYVDDSAAKTPQWMTWTLTDPLRAAAPFAPADMTLMPWNRGTAWTTPAPAIGLPRVTVSGQRNGEKLTIRVVSQRNAGRISLFLRGGTIKRTNGVAPPTSSGRLPRRFPDGWQLTAGNGVQELVVDVEAKGRVDVIASDTTFSFPPAGAALLRARHASTAIPIQDGDVTVTRARATF